MNISPREETFWKIFIINIFQDSYKLWKQNERLKEIKKYERLLHLFQIILFYLYQKMYLFL